MNYRELQLRQINKHNLAKLTEKWKAEWDLFQQELIELKEENEQLKNEQRDDKITSLENNLADTKAELRKIETEKESLLTIKEEGERLMEVVNLQLDSLSSSIEKGIVNKNWKKEIPLLVQNIKNLLIRNN